MYVEDVKDGICGFYATLHTEYCYSFFHYQKIEKNGCHFINIDHMEKFQITDFPKFGSPVF